jgi:hypothetical protein
VAARLDQLYRGPGTRGIRAGTRRMVGCAKCASLPLAVRDATQRDTRSPRPSSMQHLIGHIAPALTVDKEAAIAQ